MRKVSIMISVICLSLGLVETLVAQPAFQFTIQSWATYTTYDKYEFNSDSSALVLDETFVTAGQSHHSMETRTAMANWQNGKCYIYGSTQSQTAVMEDLPKYITPKGEEEILLENIVYISE